MKKSLLILCMAALSAHAQPYGENLYQHPGSFCSSGALTGFNTPGINGFVISGIQSLPMTGLPNFYIDKTGPGGMFAPATAMPFSRDYFVFGNWSCSTAPQAVTMAGVDVIEAQGSAIGGWYALAGAYDQGCFFSMLDQTGKVISTGFYPFPVGSSNITRPVLVASPNPNEYFICGSYDPGSGINIMYLLNVFENGSLTGTGSRTYTYPGNISSIFPADMMISPYTPSGVQELVVVGKATNVFGSTGSGDRGFMYRLNINTLNLAGAGTLCGKPASDLGTDAFSSISEAASTSIGGSGFVIGGNTDASASNGKLWTLKINSSGTTIYWNTQIMPSTDPAASDVITIKERFNTSGSYDYYGAVTANNGMMVIKLDNTGAPYTSSGIGNVNEFVYYGNAAAPAIARDLTFLNNTSATDVGIQVYGTEDATSGGFHYFAEAAFNGYTDVGCSNTFQTMVATSANGPGIIFFRDVITQPGLNQCFTFFIQQSANMSVPTIVLCNSPVLPAGGTNARAELATGINVQSAQDARFSVSPNPVADKMEIKLTASQNDAVEIILYDYLGRFIQTIPSTNNGDLRTATLDLTMLSIESGIYMIRANVNGVSSQQKIIYTKGR